MTNPKIHIIKNNNFMEDNPTKFTQNIYWEYWEKLYKCKENNTTPSKVLHSIMNNKDPKWERTQKLIFRYNTNKFPTRNKIDQYPFRRYVETHPNIQHKYTSENCVMGCNTVENHQHISICPKIKPDVKLAAKMINKTIQNKHIRIPAKLINIHEILTGILSESLNNWIKRRFVSKHRKKILTVICDACSFVMSERWNIRNKRLHK